jgi:hypothetical protein
MLVVNRHRSDSHRDFVPVLVSKKSSRIDRLRRFHGTGHGAVLIAEFASWLVTMKQGFRDAGMPQDLMPQMTGHSFRSAAPEHDSFLQVHHA